MPLLMLAACDGRGPSVPTPSSPPAAATSGQAFWAGGVVTDERGVPKPGASVTMAYSLPGVYLQRSATLTDASGSYAIGFTASPFASGWVARAEVVADGYEESWRSIRSTGTTAFIENFRLDPITRIAAGESIVLSVLPDVGECRGWVAELCPPVRVTVPAQGRLSIEVHPVGHSGELPPVEVCCVEGDERYGNPITVPVAPGPEVEVRVGVRRGFATTLSFLVKTSLETF